MPVPDHVHRFWMALDERIGHAQPTWWGAVVTQAQFPDLWHANYARVDAPVPRIADLFKGRVRKITLMTVLVCSLSLTAPDKVVHPVLRVANVTAGYGDKAIVYGDMLRLADEAPDGRFKRAAEQAIFADIERTLARLGIRFHTLVLADGTEMPLHTEQVLRQGDAPAAASSKKIGQGPNQRCQRVSRS